MKRALEFHDSIIGSAVADTNGLTIDLSRGYVHESNGSPGVSPGKGYVQAVRLRFTGISLRGADLPTATATISDANITVGAESYDNILPLPFKCAGDVVATFALGESGSNFVIVAGTFDATAFGEARYVEEFPGDA
jgi:hypothetical protein